MTATALPRSLHCVGGEVRPLLILAAAAVLLIPATPAYAAPVFSEVGFTTFVSGTTVSATTTVKASEPATVTNFKVCGRSASGANVDLWIQSTAVIDEDGTAGRSSARSLPAGEYRLFSCFQHNGVWWNGPNHTVTVGATTSPTAAPSTAAPSSSCGPTAPVSSAAPTSAAPTSAAPTQTTPTETASPGGPVGVPGTWTRVFADEFDTLDLTRWNTLDGKQMNNVTLAGRNVSVADGELRLRLENGTYGGAVSSSKLDGWGRAGFEAPVGSYTEARVFFPGSDAQPIFNWPAFWTSGQNWPANGEIDVAEGLSGRLTANYHYSTSSGHVADNSGPIPGTWHNAFHVYGVHRTADRITWYWDGKPVRSVASRDAGGAHTILFNAGKSNSRTPVTGDAGTVRVDYVRVWKAS